MIRSLIAGALVMLLGAADFAQVPADGVRPEIFKPVPKPVARPLPGPKDELAILAKSKVTGAVGWLVVDIETGEALAQYNADQAFAPASVAKLPTAGFALDRLGGNFQFETKIATTGPVKNEVLQGDLVLIGGGDPELDTDALLPLVLQAQERGFREIAGRFIADPGQIEQRPTIDQDQPVEAAYNPGVSGLNLNFNRARVKWSKQGIRVSAKADRLDPEVPSIEVRRGTLPGSPVFQHQMAETGERWQIADAAMRRPGEVWLPVKDPSTYAAQVFRDLAQVYGMALPKATVGPAPEAEVIAVYRGRPLKSVLRYMLKYSTNLTAEAVGIAASGAPNLPGSADAMNRWAAQVSGFAEGDPGFQLVNHSGLTVDSRVSPRRMVELLQALAARPNGSHLRLPGPIAGLLKRHNVAAENDKLDHKRLAVVAKTGTMNFIRGLAGYVATPGGRVLAFAIFSNDLELRAREKTRHGGWMRRARALERALVRNWVRRADQG
ncbi:MAG: D-alanyl-D-alanine carboxypeptidase/D-alanyl-D-alanine-endopeptidase [Pseudomonadota bacterium]